jgi:hypothetical protein
MMLSVVGFWDLAWALLQEAGLGLLCMPAQLNTTTTRAQACAQLAAPEAFSRLAAVDPHCTV